MTTSDTQFTLGADKRPGYDPRRVLIWPYDGIGLSNGSQPITHDTSPSGRSTCAAATTSTPPTAGSGKSRD